MRFFRGLLLGVMLSVLFLAGSAFVGVAHADWSITVTWTRSVGPGLTHEECRLDTAVKCNVLAAAPTTCQFVVPTLTGQQVLIRSYNAQGAYSDTTPVALSPVPAPASGVMVNITFVSP
jgi:hypothetical protein